MTDSDSGAATKDTEPSKTSDASTPEQKARKRWLFKKIVILVFVLIGLYFLSYGPAVTNAINQYGRTTPGFRSFYTPAGWLVRNSSAYHDYAMFWARHSRNYPWWVQNPDVSTDPLIPPRNPKSRLRFQEPPEEDES